MRRINPSPYNAHLGTTFTSEFIGELGGELSQLGQTKQAREHTQGNAL